eukprot:CAMPEP_0197526800 /NCGR_PEP_ID=MMETSP1318-20131121/19444_1 /TAXON_ID=552666 /ORGANISM="Partenskyella glossopodia, Strain RCC365" /LENGTH=389 /DNA_ID=CAMNT_0043081151 /DNA_START=160 /DNA_END=1329 /DNA_ORIENTATION=+
MSVSVDELLDHLLTKREGENSEVALRNRLYAAQLFKRLSNFYGSRPYVDSHIDLSNFAKSFCTDKQFKEMSYCWSFNFSPNFFAELAYEGFLSTCSYPSKVSYLLMPWIDPERLVMQLDKIHISKKLPRRAKKYTITANTAFQQVVEACVVQHGESWLYGPIRALFRELHNEGYTGEQKGLNFAMISIELWDEKKRLVAGDLGYSVGACYTSMTGFRAKGTQSAGTVQLVATSALLREHGFAFWDLGMVMKYKEELGGKVVSRAEFIRMFHQVRDDSKCKLQQTQHASARKLICDLRALQKKAMISSKTTSSGSANNGGGSVGAAASVDVEDVVGVSNGGVSDSGDHDGGVVSGRAGNDGSELGEDVVTRSSAMEEDTKGLSLAHGGIA